MTAQSAKKGKKEVEKKKGEERAQRETYSDPAADCCSDSDSETNCRTYSEPRSRPPRQLRQRIRVQPLHLLRPRLLARSYPSTDPDSCSRKNLGSV